MAKVIILIVLLTAIGFLAYRQLTIPKPTNAIRFEIKNQPFDLEVARTIAQKQKGLMHRTTLDPDKGMIFVSSFESPQIFWMKNTLIPLDIIFLDKNGKVINIEQATPEPNTPDHKLTLYKSSSLAKFVIELKAGTSANLELVPGDQIILPEL